MTAKVQSLRPPADTPAPPRSPEREKLAAAIARHTAAAENLARIAAARARFMADVYWPAHDALESATATLKESKADEGRILAAAFLGEADATRLDDAQRAADAAAQAVEIAQKTRTGIEEREIAAQRELDDSTRALGWRHSDAVQADPAIAALIAKWEIFNRERARLALVMDATRLFHPIGYTWHAERSYRDLPRDELDAWRAALDALRADPDAPLP